MVTALIASAHTVHPVSGTSVVALTGILLAVAVLIVFAVSFYLYRRSGRR